MESIELNRLSFIRVSPGFMIHPLVAVFSVFFFLIHLHAQAFRGFAINLASIRRHLSFGLFWWYFWL